MKTSLFVLVLVMMAGFATSAIAQEEAAVEVSSNWKLSGITGINASQTTLVNWSAGGEDAVAGNFYLNGSLKYAKDKWAWDNDLILEYGLMYSSEYNTRKNADKISFSSKLGYQITDKWYYSLLTDYNTQFAKGYDYPDKSKYLSTFMAPAYVNLALGVDHKPNDAFSFFLSPITMRTLFVMDDSLSAAGAYGIKPDKKTKIEAGALFKGSMKKEVTTNVDITSKLDMFTPYSEDFGKVDVNWEMMLSMKINEVLTTTLSTSVRYYDREITKVQFREIFGLGVAYRF